MYRYIKAANKRVWNLKIDVDPTVISIGILLSSVILSILVLSAIGKVPVFVFVIELIMLVLVNIYVFFVLDAWLDDQ